MRKNKTAVVLVSGGMDSCLTADIASDTFRLAFLHVNYGQQTESKELLCFNQLCRYFKADLRLVVDISYLKQIGGSSLTDSELKIPDASDSHKNSIPNTYVPFRNGNLLSIAASWAEVLSASYIYIGAVEEDSSGYPDCRESFFRTFENALNEGTKPETKIEIITPLIHLSKKEIVLEALKRNSPLHLTWSCYKNGEEACGECESCMLRLKGFSLAGAEDPLKYAKKLKIA